VTASKLVGAVAGSTFIDLSFDDGSSRRLVLLPDAPAPAIWGFFRALADLGIDDPSALVPPTASIEEGLRIIADVLTRAS
jgi:hypothetical protein